MKGKTWMGVGVCLLATWTGSGLAQTRLDLRTQSKSIDFSGADSTKPTKSGTVLPSACTSGELFFKTDATPGSNLFACTATNTWTMLVGSGSSGGGTSVTPVALTRSGNTLTMATGICMANNGAPVSYGTSTISVTTGTETGQFYLGYDTSCQRVCYVGPGLSIANYGIIGFSGGTCLSGTPPASGFTQAGTVQVTSGSMQDPVNTLPEAMVNQVQCGPGLLSNGFGCSVDATTVVRKFFGSGTPGGISGSARGDEYFDTSVSPNLLYLCQNAAGCTSSGWVRIDGAGVSSVSGFATAPVGYHQCLMGLCSSRDGSGSSASFSGTVREFVFTPLVDWSISSITLSVATGDASGCSGQGCALSVGIADANHTLLAQGTVSVATSGPRVLTLSSPVALTAFAKYHIRMYTNSIAALTVAGATEVTAALNATGAARVGACSTPVSNPGSSQTLPSSCGTHTASASTFWIPFMVIE